MFIGIPILGTSILVILEFLELFTPLVNLLEPLGVKFWVEEPPENEENVCVVMHKMDRNIFIVFLFMVW